MPGFSYLVSVLHTFFDWIFTMLQAVGIPNYGLAILLLTIAIRTAVQPLSMKSAPLIENEARDNSPEYLFILLTDPPG